MLAKLGRCVRAPSRSAGGIIHSMRELKALTGLRANAAIWVLFFHSSFSDLSFVPSFASSLMSAGFAAVSLFFVLSGFILTYNYFPLDEGSQSRNKPSRYFVARFARIYPVYVLAFFLGAIAQGQLLNPANDPLPPWWLNVVTFLGLQNWTSARDWINFPSWSVSCELFFYFSLPFLLYSLRRIDPKRVKFLLPAAAIVATLVGFVGAVYAAPHSTLEFRIRYLPLLRLPEFLTGVFLGYVYKRSRVPKYVEAHGDLLALAGGLLAAATILLFRKQPLFLHSGGLTIPYAIVIIGLAEATGPIYRLLSSPAAIMLGEASYSIYILQIPFKYLMADFWAMHAGDAARPVWFRGITFFGVIGFAVLVNKVFENPARKAILKLVQPRAGRPGAAPA
jgi:peptidoglycan/LPS O-acetylase OafA/YrhL